MPLNGRGGRGYAGAPGGRGRGEAMARGVQAGEAIINELLSSGGGPGGPGGDRFSGGPNVSGERTGQSSTQSFFCLQPTC